VEPVRAGRDRQSGNAALPEAAAHGRRVRRAGDVDPARRAQSCLDRVWPGRSSTFSERSTSSGCGRSGRSARAVIQHIDA
jgi:hypothetical protein